MTRIIGLGAGGHAKVVIEILRAMGGYEFVGLLDPQQELWGTEVLGVPVLGDDTLLSKLRNQGVEFAFIGVGTVGDTQPRERLFQKVRQQGFQIVSAIHPQAIVSPSAKIGHGPTIMARSVINATVRVGDNVIINTGAIVEHDCIIGDHSHIATGAQLASTVKVGNGTHIGAGATVIQCINIGENVLVGAGSVVIRDVPKGMTVAGCPARVIKRI